MVPAALFLSVLMAGAAGQPEAALATRVDRYLAPLVASHEFSGVVLVAHGDRQILERLYGKANWELGTPITPDTRFHIASVTKTFTGAAIAILAERGKLSLTDPVSKFLPEFPSGDKITVRLLGLHQSGVPNPDSLPCSDATLDDIVAEVAKKPLWFPPGQSSGYSNGGFALLARLIERASGKSWEDFLRSEIFKPLGLNATARDAAEPLMPMRAAGYAPGPGATGLINAPCSSAQAAFGSGDLVSTAGDLYRWARAVRNETLFKRTALEHPYGWGVRKYFDRRAIEQSGVLSGTASYLAAYLDDDLYVVVLSNIQGAALENVGKGVAALTFGSEPPKLSVAPTSLGSTPEQRAAWVGHFQNPKIGGFSIEERNGALYQRWERSPYGSYIMATGSDAAYDSQEAASMQLVRDADGRVSALRLSWNGGEPSTFKKE